MKFNIFQSLSIRLILITFTLISLTTSAQPPKSYILLIGMEKVDNESLQQKRSQTFNNEATKYARESLNHMKKVLSKNQTDLIILINESASKKNILDTISYIGKSIHNNDTFLFYFYGHGYQIPDKNKDEKDTLDEVLVVYDDYLIDDEVNQLFKRNFSKTRNLMLVDACHSGSSNKGNFYFDLKTPSIADYNKIKKNSKQLEVKKDICESENTTILGEPYNLIYFGATNDESTVQSYKGGGIIAFFLDEKMSEIRNNPTQLQNYTYKKLACDLSALMIKQVCHEKFQFHELTKASRNQPTGIPFEF